MLTTSGSTSLISELTVDASFERSELRATVSKLARSYGRAYLKEVVKEKRQPTELWEDLGRAGFLGVHLPEEYGGGGGGIADLSIVIEENAAAGIPLFMIVISPSIAGPIIATHGSDEQKAHWLPGIASGELKVAFSITEPDAGLNTHNIATSVTARTGGGWTLNGQKYWTSGADEADALLVVARSDQPDERGRGRLSLFLVPTDTPGITLQEIDSALCLPEKQFVVFYDDVEVLERNIIGGEGEGLRQVFTGLNPERIAAASMANGIGRYAVESGATYAKNRQVWSTPIGAHQGVAHPLARSHIEVQSSRLLCSHAAQLFDADLDASEASNMAKFCAGQAATNALDRAIQVHGGNGLSNEFNLSDLWFVARMFRTAPVSEEMILNHIAQHSLGLPKSY